MLICRTLSAVLNVQLAAARFTARLLMKHFRKAAQASGPMVLVADGFEGTSINQPHFLNDDFEPADPRQRVVNHLERCHDHPDASKGLF